MSTVLAADLEKYCVFRQANMLFALPASSVVEVAPSPTLVPLPATDPVLAGIAHLRNEFLAVLDLAELMDAEDLPASGEQQLLVVSGVQGNWGLYVDRVLGLEQLEIANNSEVHDADDWASVGLGSATLHGEVARVLNPNAVYRLAESLLTRAWSSSADRIPPGADAKEP